MYLIESLVKRGLSLQDVFDKINEKYDDYIEAKKLKEKILKSFLMEQEIVKEDEDLNELCKLISNQTMTNLKTHRILQEFNPDTKQINKGYITNIFYRDVINENPGILAYIFNRIKRLGEYEVTEYNKEYLDIKTKRFTEKLAMHSAKLRNTATRQVLNIAIDDFKGSSKTIKEPVILKTKNEVDNEIEEISNRAKLIKKSLETKKYSIERYEEIDIDSII